MDNKTFKILFNIAAIENDFVKSFGGWFKESPECIVTLVLQKSNYGNYYQLIIKVYVQGIFGNSYSISKSLLNGMGDVFRGAPTEYNDIFDFDNMMDDKRRIEKLNDLFKNFISPFASEALTRDGIISLAKKEMIYLLPAVKQQL
jgi:hypothetical protein